MTRGGFSYWLGIAGWLVIWGGAFSVSALASRLRLHGRTRGDVLLTARDLIAAVLALCGWLALRNGGFRLGLRPLYVELLGARPSTVDWILGILASSGTGLYLALVARRGVRHVATPNMYMQRHPLIPLRILSFVIFQQTAATLLLLDWNRRFAADGIALVWTALVFGLTHLGVACFGLSLHRAALLTAGSGAAMILWGALRIHAHSLWAPLLTHYLFYIGLACHHARSEDSMEGDAIQDPVQGS